MYRHSILMLATFSSLALAPQARAIRILVYDHNSNKHLARDAAISIAPLGPFGTTVVGASNFNISLHSSDTNAWDVVAVDCPSTIPTGGWGPLINYVNDGGSVILSYWNWDVEPALRQAFGIDGTLGKLQLTSSSIFVGQTLGGHLGLYAGVDLPNSDWTSSWGDDGDSFNLTSGAATSIGAISGFGPVMARKSNGRAIACFVLDEAGPTWVADARNLWRNMIRSVAQSVCPRDVIIDLSPGTGPPPATLGPYVMTPFPTDTPCPPASTFTHPSPLGGTLQCGITEHRNVVGGPPNPCPTWPSWSHGYTGDVFYTGSSAMFLDTFFVTPPNTGAFYFYAQPAGGTHSLGIRIAGRPDLQVPISGAGGAQYIGVYALGGVLHEIELYNPPGQTALWLVGEFGIAPAGQVLFTGAPETAAPPQTLGPFVMAGFPPLPCPGGTLLSIPAPILGDIVFSEAVDHARVGGTPPCGAWPSWSHGYTGDVYVTKQSMLTLFPPAATAALSFYIQPTNPGSHVFVVTANDGDATSGVDMIQSAGGAEFFGFHVLGGGQITSLVIQQTGDTAGGFAIGEFAIAQTSCFATCIGDVNGDGMVNGLDVGIVLGSWTGSATYDRCPLILEGDFNGDCRINGLDLAILLGAWGPC